MHCPYCQNLETKVIDKRDSDGITKRRRECLECQKRFNTLERVEDIQFRVIKKNGSREDFDRDKIKRGIIRACEKRPINIETIEKMLNNIEERIRKQGEKEVKSDFIGSLVSKELKKVDKVAYIRFASVYQEFTDIDDFKKEIKELS